MYNGPRIQIKTIHFLFKKYMFTKNVKFYVLTKIMPLIGLTALSFMPKYFFILLNF